jgi:Mg2+/Co2+ transporter CorB
LDDISLSLLFGLLALLIMLSALFSGTETSMMALNRYRLRHLVKDRHRSAMLVSRMLERPDRLLGLILFGNNLVNISAASVTTIIAIKLVGDIGILPASLLLTGVILIVGEVAPKTIAAMHPERIAYPMAYILLPLSWLLYPFVWIINQCANGIISMLGVQPAATGTHMSLSSDELRTVVDEAGKHIPRRHKKMLLGILDLGNVKVEDIMVSRNDIVGIDLNASTADIVEVLNHCQHTRLPVYRDNIDNIIGILHVRYLPRILKNTDEFKRELLEDITREPEFVPLGTPLQTQLLNFQRKKVRVGLVVDEYGMIQGLVTLEDILEEIVGEFTTDLQTFDQDIHPQDDGSYVIKGSAMLRDINKQLGWDLPVDGARTLNGLILERLEDIPETGTSLRIGDFTMEITQTVGNAVKTAQVRRLPGENTAR